ncbi:MAG: ABC transporter substrate-binding protein [Nitrososphaerota archaeon]|nr:ABC transporter substrate-binding protein [Candidatus Bathyarchaeota archaeon]MDW8022841.1 ABC transporter substrate-binding protein [Nitrososphaerota archaeon]
MFLTSKRLFAVIIAVIMASASFAAGYHIGYNAGLTAAPKVVRVGYLMADIHHTPFFVAFSKGFYENEGIAPKRLEYVNGPAQMIAFSAGDLDAGYVGVVPALMAKAKGVDLVIVASSNLEGSAIVSKNEIKSVLELDKRVVGAPGIGTIQDCLLYMIERKFNITVAHQHYKVSDLPAALEKGEIDAYIAWEPFATEAAAKGIGHIIYASRDILPNHQCCIFYVSGKIYREQPDLLRKLLKVHIRAIRFVIDNGTDSMKIFSNTTGKSMEVVENSWKNIIWDYHPNVESIKLFVKYLIEQGKISIEDVPDIDKFVDEAFPADLRKLLEEMEAAD